jgi:hypothetical protein
MEDARAIHEADATIRKLDALPSPIELNSLRSNLNGFHPPQAYRYLTPEELEAAKVSHPASLDSHGAAA